MKEIIRVISLITIIPLLAGCNDENIEPRFANEGEKISLEEFNENIQSNIKESGFFSDDENFIAPSYKAEIKQKQLLNYVLKRNRVTIVSSYKESDDLKVSQKADSNNEIIEVESKSTRTSEDKRPESQNFSKTNDISRYIYQKNVVDNEECMVKVAPIYKQYVVENTIDESHSYNYYFNRMTPDPTRYLVFISSAASWFAPSIEDKAEYCYYKNNKILTVESTFENVIETKTESSIDKIVIQKFKGKIQFDYSKSNGYRITYCTEETYNTEYNVDMNDYFSGDVNEASCKIYMQADIKKDDISLQAQDISNYKKIDSAI